MLRQITLLSVGGVLALVVIAFVVSARIAPYRGAAELADAEASAEGAGLRGIAVTDADVDLAGASKITLTMDGGALSGSMAGAGSIEYYGAVAGESVRVAGAARVERAR